MKVCPQCLASYPAGVSVCAKDGAVLEELPKWQPGAIIQGKFCIVSKVGSGRIGVVFKAENLALKEMRALKLLLGQVAHDERLVQLLRQEIHSARILNHANAVRVEDLCRAEDGSVFLVMEYVPGESLGDTIRKNGPLPVLRVVQITRQICSVLEFAHSLGVVHRDIRPDNILLVQQPDDRYLVKVLDFGMAKFKERVAERGIEIGGIAKTKAGLAVGVPPYMSPEQSEGLSVQGLDRRSDLFSLGVLMYAALTGEPPWPPDASPDSPPLPLQGRREDLKLPDLAVEIVMKALKNNPALRYQSASEMTLALSMAEELLEREAETKKKDSKSSEGFEIIGDVTPATAAVSGSSDAGDAISISVSPPSFQIASSAEEKHVGGADRVPAAPSEFEILESEPILTAPPSPTSHSPQKASFEMESFFETPSLLLGDFASGQEAGAAAPREAEAKDTGGGQPKQSERRASSPRVGAPSKGPTAPSSSASQLAAGKGEPAAKGSPVRTASAAQGPSSRLDQPAKMVTPVRGPSGVQSVPGWVGPPLKAPQARKLPGLAFSWNRASLGLEGSPLRAGLIALTFILLVLLGARLIFHVVPWTESSVETPTNNQPEVGTPASQSTTQSPPIVATTSTNEAAPPPAPKETPPPSLPKEGAVAGSLSPTESVDVGRDLKTPISEDSRGPAGEKRAGLKNKVQSGQTRDRAVRTRSSPAVQPRVRRLSPAQQVELRDKLVVAGFLLDRSDTRGAIDAYEAALKIDPTNPDAKAGLARARLASDSQKAGTRP